MVFSQPVGRADDAEASAREEARSSKCFRLFGIVLRGRLLTAIARSEPTVVIVARRMLEWREWVKLDNSKTKFENTFLTTFVFITD